jgi:hypothetical protein
MPALLTFKGHLLFCHITGHHLNPGHIEQWGAANMKKRGTTLYCLVYSVLTTAQVDGNAGAGETSRPGTGQPRMDNVPGTGTGAMNCAEIPPTEKAKYKSEARRTITRRRQKQEGALNSETSTAPK